jgi:sterol desaturase/sphingolipid hydroxylase (fatty acid hydroxylase superfamily)
MNVNLRRFTLRLFAVLLVVGTKNTYADMLMTHLNAAPSVWLQADAWQWLSKVFAFHVVMEGSRYLLGALMVWGIVHGLLKRRLAHRLIDAWPTWRDIRREMAYSLSTLLIFAAIGLVIFTQIMRGNMVIYQQPAQYGWAWLVCSQLAMIVWHDAYFYVTHRLLHTPWLFRHVHGVHHRSRNPSPWAAYAFHPIEAVVNALVVPLALCVVPLHISVIFIFGVHQILRNAHGHAAIETMPRGFATHWLGGRFTTTTHHHLHHENAKGNYGLWFTWWDRWCKTERSDYLARFERITAQRPAKGV